MGRLRGVDEQLGLRDAVGDRKVLCIEEQRENVHEIGKRFQAEGRSSLCLRHEGTTQCLLMNTDCSLLKYGAILS